MLTAGTHGLRRLAKKPSASWRISTSCRACFSCSRSALISASSSASLRPPTAASSAAVRSFFRLRQPYNVSVLMPSRRAAAAGPISSASFSACRRSSFVYRFPIWSPPLSVIILSPFLAFGDSAFMIALHDVFAYLEAFYNAIRPHSALGWLSPASFEAVLPLLPPDCNPSYCCVFIPLFSSCFMSIYL